MKLLVASLLTLGATTAIAGEDVTKTQQQDKPRPRDKCVVGKLDGAALVQLDHRSFDKGATERQMLITSSGAWRYATTRDGKQLEQKLGCLDVAEVAELEDVFARASWSFTLADIKCRAEASGFTQYRYEGRLMAMTQVCDGKVFDKTTKRALDLVNAVALKLVPKT